MAERHAWNGEKIDELPHEILNYSMRDAPRSTLKDLASRLNADSITKGNWEDLAEKLGVTQNAEIDQIIQQAKVQNTFPGLLLLNRWTRHPGSTAFVLLHALREIEREDVLRVLVDKLFELHTMNLSVSVETWTGVHQYLRVRTRKSAPLHASLDNILQNELYWYDIIGPRLDLSWNTPSMHLEGAQLTLKLRDEPNQDSRDVIYGRSFRVGGCQAPAESPLAIGMHHVEVDGEGARASGAENQIQTLNIPIGPRPNNVSVTVPVDSSNHHNLFNVRADGPGVCLINNLSAGQHSPPKMISSSELSENYSPRLAPRARADSQASKLTMGAGDSQPMAEGGYNVPDNLPLLSDFNNTLSSFASVSNRDNDFTTLQSGVGFSHTFVKNCPMTSFTDIKQVAMAEHTDGRVPSEHDETSSKRISAAENACKPPEAEAFAERMNLNLHEESVKSQCASSLLHPDYIDHSSVIEFYNQPACPPSCSSGSSSTVSYNLGPLVGGCGKQAGDPTHHFVHRNSEPQLCATQSANQQTPFLVAKQQWDGGQGRAGPGTDYVSHLFIEEQSRKFSRSTSAPELGEDDTMHVEDSHTGLEKMDCGEVQTSSCVVTSGCVSSLSSQAHISSAPNPTPCSYSAYRPDLAQPHRFCINPPPQPCGSHGRASETESGYMDMSGTERLMHHHGNGVGGLRSPETDRRLPPHTSMDSYLINPLAAGFDPKVDSPRQNFSLDSSVRNLSSPDLSHLHHPRNRRPLPQNDGNDSGLGSAGVSARGGGDSSGVFQPRSRRPLGHDCDALLDIKPVTGSDYDYIDAASCAASVNGSHPARSGQLSPGTESSHSSSCEQRDRQRSSHQQRSSVSVQDLQQVPGWHPNANKKTVHQEMARYINDDGNFIVWRYDGRYVISVSHLREIQHYAVYESERGGRSCLYIFKGEHFTSLTSLVSHCQQHGLSGPVKTFLTPDGRETQRGSGQYSHVQLKNPIPIEEELRWRQRERIGEGR